MARFLSCAVVVLACALASAARGAPVIENHQDFVLNALVRRFQVGTTGALRLVASRLRHRSLRAPAARKSSFRDAGMVL